MKHTSASLTRHRQSFAMEILLSVTNCVMKVPTHLRPEGNFLGMCGWKVDTGECDYHPLNSPPVGLVSQFTSVEH